MNNYYELIITSIDKFLCAVTVLQSKAAAIFLIKKCRLSRQECREKKNYCKITSHIAESLETIYFLMNAFSFSHLVKLKEMNLFCETFSNKK